MRSTKRIKERFLLCLLFVFATLLPNNVGAHPGNTDAYGGHTCRTNCYSWGYSYGEYHYHDTYYDYSYSYTPVVDTRKTYNVGSKIGESYCYIYADAEEAIDNFIKIYEEELLRLPTCDELDFQVDHVTPHDKLRSYLQGSLEYSARREIVNYGCSPFYDRLGQSHADMIFDTYKSITGRNPLCNEMKQHAIWETPKERLTSFLEPYRYSVVGRVVYDGRPATTAEVRIFYDRNFIGQGITNQEGYFGANFLDPNKKYRFKIEYKGRIKNFRKETRPGKKNFFELRLTNEDY